MVIGALFCPIPDSFPFLGQLILGHRVTLPRYSLSLFVRFWNIFFRPSLKPRVSVCTGRSLRPFAGREKGTKRRQNQTPAHTRKAEQARNAHRNCRRNRSNRNDINWKEIPIRLPVSERKDGKGRDGCAAARVDKPRRKRTKRRLEFLREAQDATLERWFFVVVRLSTTSTPSERSRIQPLGGKEI